MDWLHGFVDLVLHLDRHLVQLLAQYGAWLYGVLFVVVFAETGFVVTPMLPGDSLLFGAGALAAADRSGTLALPALFGALSLAAVGGNTLNYAIGRHVGTRAFSGHSRWFRLEYLQRTEQYFRRHGAKAIVLSRFVPIVRTFAPFVAGIGRMPLGAFQLSNLAGAAGWVGLFLGGGYLFGNLPWVRGHFSVVTVLIVGASLVPLIVMGWRDRRSQ